VIRSRERVALATVQRAVEAVPIHSQDGQPRPGGSHGLCDLLLVMSASASLDQGGCQGELAFERGVGSGVFRSFFHFAKDSLPE